MRHCERSEAIHRTASGEMDRFVASAQNCFAILSLAPRNDADAVSLQFHRIQ
jgi:hypothetical protein